MESLLGRIPINLVTAIEDIKTSVLKRIESAPSLRRLVSSVFKLSSFGNAAVATSAFSDFDKVAREGVWQQVQAGLRLAVCRYLR